jgi:hypothetical protein
MAANGDSSEMVEERVAFIVDQAHPTKFLPRISIAKTVDRIGRARVDKTFRAFETDDIARVLDFEQVPDPPPDGPMMHYEVHPEKGLDFPSRHFCLRGGFLFYFDLNDVSGTGQSHYITYHGPPLGVIPLDKVIIEFPPGGRRCFREHAETEARNGYELAIVHKPDGNEQQRSAAFIVCDSLGMREKWSSALKERAKMKDQPTKLRTGVFAADSTMISKPDATANGDSAGVAIPTNAVGIDKSKTAHKRMNRKGSQDASHEKYDPQQPPVQEALQEFGKSNFSDKAWIDNYFETHTDFDAPARCKQMETMQDMVKKGLKTAVLEQYEYFVEASGEMTTMGREVIALKTLVETQVETIKEMKEIDFSSVLNNADEEGSEAEGPDAGKGRIKPRRFGKNGGPDADYDSDESSVSSYGGKQRSGEMGRTRFRDPKKKEGAIEIPDWFEDANEEILAYVKESRYTDATNHWAKSKEEVTKALDQVSKVFLFSFALFFMPKCCECCLTHLSYLLFYQHEQPTDNLLTKKEFSQVHDLKQNLDELAEMITGRLVENLRRKNEALKQAMKRERADPLAQMVPSISPCCLNDDVSYLRLLVKLGKTQDAASAYSTRRSLLLLER